MFLLSLISLISLSLTSCTLPRDSSKTTIEARNSPADPAAVPVKPDLERPLTPPPLKQPTTPSASTTSVTLYQPDSNCQTLVPRPAIAPVENSLEFAVARVFELNSNDDFPVAYRLQIDPDHQIVTIDLRLPSTVQRPFTALSACEQLALFGSVRKTLMDQPPWYIRQVQFTHQGQEIVL
ncbi:MAG: hypothetical protein HC835_03325 [Oscillatoriales cyanobacterium RM2_1_1]|nr:hypothetical protein [Oscillatoriales cyanobacterium SM2_3_0]NJO44725.1 hypothetical protein [Oscillatoriales cyanobacterium RM2_1_1]